MYSRSMQDLNFVYTTYNMKVNVQIKFEWNDSAVS